MWSAIATFLSLMAAIAAAVAAWKSWRTAMVALDLQKRMYTLEVRPDLVLTMSDVSVEDDGTAGRLKVLRIRNAGHGVAHNATITLEREEGEDWTRLDHSNNQPWSAGPYTLPAGCNVEIDCAESFRWEDAAEATIRVNLHCEAAHRLSLEFNYDVWIDTQSKRVRGVYRSEAWEHDFLEAQRRRNLLEDAWQRID